MSRQYEFWSLCLALCSGFVLAGGSATAADTQYRYDAQGQVMLITRSTGAQVGYGYDLAGNRISLVANQAVYPTYSDRLLAGQALTPGKKIISPNGLYYLILQDDGNFVVYGPTGARWASHTNSVIVARCDMQFDGHLVLYGPLNQVAWTSGTYNNPGAALLMQDDGNLVIYSSSGAPLWSIYGNP